MEDVDKILIENIKKNDYASYNHLFMRYYKRLCIFVSRITGNDDAEDIIQELFIKLWVDRKKLFVHKNISGYLHQSAKNMALNHIRSEATRRDVVDKMYQTLSIEAETVDEEYIIALDICIGRLPARGKEVLLLHRVEGYKHMEISEKLNISVQTVKNQIWLSLQRLKACLALKGI